MSSLALVDTGTDLALDEEQLVTMIVNKQLFGIPIAGVQDIVVPAAITPVPLAPAAVAGVLNLRGRIVTVIDMRECLGDPPLPLDAVPMSVTVELGTDIYTLLVDDIGDVRAFPRAAFEDPPITMDSQTRALCSGVYKLDKELLVVLSIDKVLDPERISAMPTRTRPRMKLDREAAKAKSANAANESLFDQLGGAPAIDAAVDLLYQKVMGDDTLTPFFEGADMPMQGAMMRDFLTQAFGGPQDYKGRDMRSAHQRLVHEKGLSEQHFNAVAGHLDAVLKDLNVPAELAATVMGAAGGLKDDILDL